MKSGPAEHGAPDHPLSPVAASEVDIKDFLDLDETHRFSGNMCEDRNL